MNSVEARNLAYNAVTGAVTHLSLHTGDPGRTGANEVAGGSYARQVVAYGPPSDGAGDITERVSVPVPAGVEITHWGCWDGDTFLFGGAFANGQPYASDGIYHVDTAGYVATDGS